MSLKITQDNFQSEVLSSSLPVLLDFWAPWCGPCKMIGPVIDQIAVELEGIAKVGKVDVDECSALAAQYNVRSIPTFLFFKDGELIDTVVGASSKDALKSRLMGI